MGVLWGQYRGYMGPEGGGGLWRPQWSLNGVMWGLRRSGVYMGSLRLIWGLSRGYMEPEEGGGEGGGI